jgi:hypothetical protein
MNLNRATLKSTLAAVIGMLAVVGPMILAKLGTPTNFWGALAVQAAGGFILACTTGRAILWLNKLLPDATRSTDASVSDGGQIRPMPPTGVQS